MNRKKQIPTVILQIIRHMARDYINMFRIEPIQEMACLD